MRMGILVIMCIHMLLWAGCDSIQSSRKLGYEQSGELETLNADRYTPGLKLGTGFWRKLLEENAGKADNINEEETRAKSQDEKGAAEKAEVVEEVKVEPVATTAQKEEVKVEPVAATEQKEEVKVEPVAATAQKEEVKVEPVAADTAQKEDMKRDEPKSEVIQKEIPKEVRASEETKIHVVEEVKKMETQEVNGQAATERTPVQSQDLQKEQNNAPGVDEAATKLLESVDEAAPKLPETVEEAAPKLPETVEEAAPKLPENEGRTEEHEDQKPLPQAGAVQVQKEEESQIKAEVVQETPVEKIDLEENTDISSAEVQTVKPEDVKEQNSVAAAVEDEKQDDVQEQKTETLAESKEEDLIKMVESGVTESVDSQQTAQLDLDAKMERIENPTDDSKVDDNKTEEKNESSDDNTEKEDKSMESKEKETEDNDKVEMPEVKNEEAQAATNEVESQLEELRRDSVFDPMVDRRQEKDPSDDDYDIMQELADLPTKFQETAGKVADHLRPDLLKWSDTSKVYFNLANQQITESFSPLIGKQYAPFLASMISYGILLLPLIVAIMLFEHIRALLSLQKVLLFVNIYLAAYFATLWLASFIIGLEPMSFFYQNSLSSYLSLQLLQALGYVVYLILQTANIINSCTSDTFVGKLTAVLQWIVAVSIGLHYYVTVFHPAVASKPPHTNWKIYAIYSAAFFILCLFARIRWVKKQYVSSGNDITNKKS